MSKPDKDKGDSMSINQRLFTFGSLASAFLVTFLLADMHIHPALIAFSTVGAFLPFWFIVYRLLDN